jgi:DeoR/GlpR family transcriptional regulator of sugar metabolism
LTQPQVADVAAAIAESVIHALVTPADKLRSASPWVVAALSGIDHLVTDGDAALTRPYAAAGIGVVTV